MSTHAARLAQKDPVWLYHQTDPNAATSILTSQRMLRGSAGLVGGGIYFGETAQESIAKCGNEVRLVALEVDGHEPLHDFQLQC